MVVEPSNVAISKLKDLQIEPSVTDIRPNSIDVREDAWVTKDLSFDRAKQEEKQS